MKQKIHHYVSMLAAGLLLAIASCSFSSCSQPSEAGETAINDHLSVPALLERKRPAGPKEEQDMIRKTYDDAVAALKANSSDYKQYLKLATAFISEGRITGNNSYYGNAAVKMLNTAIAGNPRDKDIVFESLSLKSAVLLNMHQFRDALAVAQQARSMNDFSAAIYGSLVDAHVELGNYDEAVKDCDKMLSIRPDIRSYSRASYLRQLHGDNEGAIAAMKMAVESGVPGMESTEWARVNWGDLYYNTGKLDTATMIYNSSLTVRPGYPYAYMGLARVAAARKQYDEAIAQTRNAIKTLPEAAFVSYLGDLYMLKGDKAKAMETYKDVVQLLEEGEQSNTEGALVKHNAHRELAMAYLNTGDYEKALQHAKADYDMRPGNMDANELMAWVLFKKGDFAAAKTYQDKVFITHARNAGQLFKAGIVYAAAGDAVTGNRMKHDAQMVTPYIDPRITALN